MFIVSLFCCCMFGGGVRLLLFIVCCWFWFGYVVELLEVGDEVVEFGWG